MLRAMVVACSAIAGCLVGVPAIAATPSPEVSGPVSGGLHGYAYNEWPFPLADQGYRQDEYFISGSARAFGVDKPNADYRTRIQVFRPINPDRFSGTAIVEWNNETAQGDLPVDWNLAHPYVMRSGDVYVTATVQQVGTCGVGVPDYAEVRNHPRTVPVCSPLSLKAYDPVRYGSVHIPDGDYSYDIFSQVVKAVRSPDGLSPTGGLKVRWVLAAGQSQSSQQLDVYLCNGADRAAHVIDGALSDDDLARYLDCAPRVPTIRLWGEDSATPDRATNGPTVRTWMVPGAAHGDNWLLQFLTATVAHNETGVTPGTYSEVRRRAADYGQQGLTAITGASCAPAGNMYPRHMVVDTALEALKRWVSDDRQPPAVPSIKFSAIPDLNSLVPAFSIPTAFQRDLYGNTLGGLRTPVLDVPVATYIGNTCGLLGQTIPSPLAAVKYHSHTDYVTQFADAADSAVAHGYMLRSDADELLDLACASNIGDSTASSGGCPRVGAQSPYERHGD